MSKSKKKPAASNTSPKTAKKTLKKVEKKAAKKPKTPVVSAKKAKPVKAAPKAEKGLAAKSLKAPAVKAVANSTKSPKSVAAAKPAKTAPVAKIAEAPKKAATPAAKQVKLSPEELKKKKKAEQDAAKMVAKAKEQKPAKGKKPQDEEAAEFEELEQFETYGDAIRLTAEDLEEPEDIFLTDAEGRRYCKVKDCDQLAVVEGHCRLHYLALWKKLQTRKKILTDGKLEKYVEELTSRYPDKYIEMIRRDLKTEKDFLSAIQELEIDESADGDLEEDSSFIEEVRGIAPARGGRGEDSGGGGGEEF